MDLTLLVESIDKNLDESFLFDDQSQDDVPTSPADDTQTKTTK